MKRFIITLDAEEISVVKMLLDGGPANMGADFEHRKEDVEDAIVRSILGQICDSNELVPEEDIK